jgi:hypothetical protein
MGVNSIFDRQFFSKKMILQIGARHQVPASELSLLLLPRRLVGWMAEILITIFLRQNWAVAICLRRNW